MKRSINLLLTITLTLSFCAPSLGLQRHRSARHSTHRSSAVRLRASRHTPPQHATVYSSDDYYTNVDGERVHRPVHTASRPAGATAQCRDGSYSFSRHRQGTCSHHGGVSVWF